jgi:predicted PurR-regulated permease PerM
MELLQLVNKTADFQDYFLQYGVLGIVSFILGYMAIQQYKNLIKKNDKLEQKIDHLQDEMMGLLEEERDRLAELIKDNTAALTELQRTIFQYLVKKPD